MESSSEDGVTSSVFRTIARRQTSSRRRQSLLHPKEFPETRWRSSCNISDTYFVDSSTELDSRPKERTNFLFSNRVFPISSRDILRK